MRGNLQGRRKVNKLVSETLINREDSIESLRQGLDSRKIIPNKSNLIPMIKNTK